MPNALVLALCAAVPPPTEASTVVLVSGGDCCADTSDVAIERLVAVELRALGLEVLVTPATTSIERERRIELGVIAEEKQARAALRVLVGADGVVAELWMNRDVAGRALFRRLGVKGRHTRQAPALIALRVAELMRSQLTDAGPEVDEPAPAVETLAPAQVETLAEALPRDAAGAREVAIEGSLTAVGARGLPGPWVAAALAASWRPIATVGLAADALTTLADRHVVNKSDRAVLGLSALRLWALWRPWADGRLEPELSAGLGGMWLRSRGESSAQLISQRDDAWLGYLGAGASVAWHLSSWSAAVVAGRVGWCRPEVSVLFGGASVAGFRPPVWEASVGWSIQGVP